MFIFESGYGLTVRSTVVRDDEARLSYHRVNRDEVKMVVDRLKKDADEAVKKTRFALSLAGEGE
jgi:hypothetical protein